MAFIIQRRGEWQRTVNGFHNTAQREMREGRTDPNSFFYRGPNNQLNNQNHNPPVQPQVYAPIQPVQPRSVDPQLAEAQRLLEAARRAREESERQLAAAQQRQAEIDRQLALAQQQRADGERRRQEEQQREEAECRRQEELQRVEAERRRQEEAEEMARINAIRAATEEPPVLPVEALAQEHNGHAPRAEDVGMAPESQHPLAAQPILGPRVVEVEQQPQDNAINVLLDLNQGKIDDLVGPLAQRFSAEGVQHGLASLMNWMKSPDATQDIEKFCELVNIRNRIRHNFALVPVPAEPLNFHSNPQAVIEQMVLAVLKHPSKANKN